MREIYFVALLLSVFWWVGVFLGFDASNLQCSIAHQHLQSQVHHMETLRLNDLKIINTLERELRSKRY